MEKIPEQEKPIFDEETIIADTIEKTEPKKVWKLSRALRQVLAGRGLEETGRGDWLDKVTKQVVVDAPMFYELLAKASQKLVEVKDKKESSDTEPETKEHWWQKGQYE